MLREFKVFQVSKDLVFEQGLQEAFFNNMMRGTEVTASALAVNDVFKFVAWVNATDLDEVFAIGNGVSHQRDRILRFARMHSISVGDIIQDQDGKCWVVSSVGFQEANSLDGYIRKSFADSTYEEVGA
tara:strand:+ start:446 stop:829 length:384 start_codon:yes stop_codon:yes gene_type:complete